MVDELDGVRVIHHEGWTNGFRAQLTLVPERGVAAAVLSNGDGGAPANRDVTDFILKVRCGLARSDPQPVHVAASERERFAGSYEHKYIQAAVNEKSGALVLDAELLWCPSAPVRVTMPLQPMDSDEFVGTDGEFEGGTVRFVLGEDHLPRYVYVMGRLLRYLG